MQISLKTIFILAAVVVVVGGSFVYFLLSSPKPVAQQTVQQGVSNYNSNQSSVSVNSGTTAQKQPPPDIKGSYSDLFAKLLAQEAAFVAVDSSDKTGIYALYAKDITSAKQITPGAGDYSLHVAQVDLNGDGSAEALVYEDLPGFCGTDGCALDVYQKQSGKWVKIYSVTAQGEIGISNTSINGYAQLLLTIRGAAGNQSHVVLYTWDGKTYQPQETVAAWNGTTFVAQ